MPKIINTTDVEKPKKMRGVYKSGNKYKVILTVNGKRHQYGPYKTEQKAAEVYDKYALEFFKERAILNLSENKLKKERKDPNKRGAVTPIVQRKVANSQEWKCNLCKELLDETYQIDHAVPLFLNGKDEIDNMQALCNSCHQFKTEFLDRKSIKELVDRGENVDKVDVENLQEFHKNKLIKKSNLKTIKKQTNSQNNEDVEMTESDSLNMHINGFKISITK